MDRIFYDWYKDAKYILQPYQRNLARIGHLERLWELTQKLVEDSIGGGSGVQTVTGNAVDNTDPSNPVIDFPPSFGQNIGNSDLPIDESPRTLTMLNEGEFHIKNDYIEQSFISNGTPDTRSSIYYTFLKGVLPQTQSYLQMINEVSTEVGSEYIDLEASLVTSHRQYFGEQVASGFSSRTTDYDGRVQMTANGLDTDGVSLFGRYFSNITAGSGYAEINASYQNDSDSTLNRQTSMSQNYDQLYIRLQDDNGDLSVFHMDANGNFNLNPFEKTVFSKVIEVTNDYNTIVGTINSMQVGIGDDLNIVDDASIKAFIDLVQSSGNSTLDLNVSDGLNSTTLRVIESDTSGESLIKVQSSNPSFQGIVGNDDYSPYYVPNSFIQKSYVDVILLSVDYGDSVNVTGRNTQVFTNPSGSGTTPVNLLSQIPIGALLFVSDLGNDATNNDIVIDSGVGNTILKGDGSLPSQTLIIDSSGISFTLRKMTNTNWMVIGTNQ